MIKNGIHLTSVIKLAIYPILTVGCLFTLFGFASLTVFRDNLHSIFFELGALYMGCALILWSATRRVIVSIRIKVAPLFAVLSWLIVGLLSAVPISIVTHVDFMHAAFESFSALTTTGATILSGLDSLPPSFLIYRQFLQWLGGLGIVIFVVAILPNLNVGGMKLLKSEVPGPIKDDKLAARTMKTTHYLWSVYVFITALCAIAYYAAGMDIYDAFAHSLTTVSTGGFSIHDASLGWYHSEAIYLVSDIFMIIGALNFGIHFKLLKTKDVRLLFQNEESRVFLLLCLTISIISFLLLIQNDDGISKLKSLNHATFIVISFITSTGFGAENFATWPIAVLFLLIVSSYLGGCSGSTAGGSKIIRTIIIFKLVRREIKRLIHPKGVFAIKYQGKSISSDIVRNTTAFIFFVILSSLALTLLLMTTGLDLWSSLSAVSSCLNVLGPAFGVLSDNFQPVSNTGLAILTFAMILGRLEFLTVVVLFAPKFWRS